MMQPLGCGHRPPWHGDAQGPAYPLCATDGAHCSWPGLPEHLPQAAQPILVLNNADDLQRYTPRAMQYIRDGRLLERPDWGHGC